MTLWRPRRWAVQIGDDGDDQIVGHQRARWQFRTRRHFADVRELERFRWRDVGIGLRRPEDHWRDDLDAN